MKTKKILETEKCTCPKILDIIKFIQHLEQSANGNCPSETCNKIARKFTNMWDKNPEEMQKMLTDMGLEKGFLYRKNGNL